MKELIETPSYRCYRLARMVRDLVSRLLCTSVADPRLKSVIVTDVDVTRDLRNIKVYFLVDEDSMDAALSGLRSAKGYFKRQLAKKITLRKIPDFSFSYDHKSNMEVRINKLLQDSRTVDVSVTMDESQLH